MKKVLGWTVVIVIIGLVIFLGIRYFYVFGEGVKEGELNYVVKKGYIFKTYEGKLIQSGFRSKAPSMLQSYEFEFSVSNDSVAQRLMVNSGKHVLVHYKEYIGSVPWRGYSEFVVDSIVGITAAQGN